MTQIKPQRGRPKADSEAQKSAIFQAFMDVLLVSGYRKTTTLAIARKCGISKNTLYNHFPSKEALFVAFVHKRGIALNEHLDAAIDDSTIAIEDALKNFGRDVLAVLTSDISLALNRTAISAAASKDLSFSKAYMKYGRDPIKEKVEAMLDAACSRGDLVIDDIDTAVQDLLGLLNGDLQLRQLFAVTPTPDKMQIARKVDHAVRQFIKLYGPRNAGAS